MEVLLVNGRELLFWSACLLDLKSCTLTLSLVITLTRFLDFSTDLEHFQTWTIKFRTRLFDDYLKYMSTISTEKPTP